MTNEAQAKQDSPRSRRAQVGRVVSLGGMKTASIVVDNLVKHPTYGKYIRRRTKLAVHDEHGKAKVGDLVEIVPCRRMSKNKAHRLIRIVRSAD